MTFRPEAIRGSGLHYTIVHSGILSEGSGRRVRVGQEDLPMWPWHRIGREDVAEVLVRSLAHPRAQDATFDAVWSGRGATDWGNLFTRLEPDAAGE